MSEDYVLRRSYIAGRGTPYLFFPMAFVLREVYALSAVMNREVVEGAVMNREVDEVSAMTRLVTDEYQELERV